MPSDRASLRSHLSLYAANVRQVSAIDLLWLGAGGASPD